MKHFLLAATLAVSLALPSSAQTQIPAPSGWKTQTKAGGAVTFTPPDLRAGEIYSVTVYDAAPLGGKTPEAYLRAFAGSVGKTVANLAAPLQIQTSEGKAAVGSGVYVGPNGTALIAMFFGVSIDGGANIHMMRTLMSQISLSKRYETQNGALADQQIKRAKGEAKKDAVLVPAAIFDSMKRGGAFVPGVYAGKQITTYGSIPDSVYEYRLDLYVNGEYRIVQSSEGKKVVVADESSASVGKYEYDAKSGKIDIDRNYKMSNYIDPYFSDAYHNRYCFFGRDAAGEPFIYAEKDNTVTTLRLVGPPTGQLAPSVIAAREAAKEAGKAAIRAERDRIQTVVALGKGVPGAQVVAIVHHYESVESTTNSPDLVSMSPGTTSIYDGSYTPGIILYTPGVPQTRIDITDDTYLLLRDGTLYRGLETAPDQFDVAASRRKEPENWGLRKRANTKCRLRASPTMNCRAKRCCRARRKPA